MVLSYLDYSSILYDQAYNNSFQNKIEPFQYNAVLAITSAIIGSSGEKLHQEFGLENKGDCMENSALIMKFWNHSLQIAPIRLFLNQPDPIELEKLVKIQLFVLRMTILEIHFFLQQLLSGIS